MKWHLCAIQLQVFCFCEEWGQFSAPNLPEITMLCTTLLSFYPQISAMYNSTAPGDEPAAGQGGGRGVLRHAAVPGHTLHLPRQQVLQTGAKQCH